MKQRVMLAQALLGDPQVIILDEPTVGLDPHERIRLSHYLKQSTKGKVVIWSTHTVAEIEEIADTVLLIKKGKKLLHEPLETLLAAPSTQTLEEIYFSKMGDCHE